MLGAKTILLTLHYETSHSFPVRSLKRAFHRQYCICQRELQNRSQEFGEGSAKATSFSCYFVSNLIISPVIGIVDSKILLSVIFASFQILTGSQ